MGKRGSIELILSREFFNSLAAVLETFAVGDENNKYSIYAKRLRNKILQYSRSVRERASQSAVTYFYEDEASVLIKLLVMYAYATGMGGEDAFGQIGKGARKNENDS
jgi:hypothetical protein